MSLSPESCSDSLLSARSSMSVDSGRSSHFSGSDSPSFSPRHTSSKVSEIEAVSPRREASVWRSLSGRLESTIGTMKAKLSPSRRLSGRLSRERSLSSRKYGRGPTRSNSPKSVLDSGKYGADLEELAEAFNLIDANGDGKISSAELRSVLQSIGFELSEDEFNMMMQAVDIDGDGEIDVMEFIHHNTLPLDLAESSKARSLEMKAAFHVFDLDKNDYITADELFKVFKSLGQLTSMADCSRMIRAVDSDGDGRVNFQEFERMMSGVSY